MLRSPDLEHVRLQRASVAGKLLEMARFDARGSIPASLLVERVGVPDREGQRILGLAFDEALGVMVGRHGQ